MLLLRLSALFLLRFAERRLFVSLFQEPPRSTRWVQSGACPLEYYLGKYFFTQALRVSLLGVADPALYGRIDVLPIQASLRIARRQTTTFSNKAMAIIIA